MVNIPHIPNITLISNATWSLILIYQRFYFRSKNSFRLVFKKAFSSARTVFSIICLISLTESEITTNRASNLAFPRRKPDGYHKSNYISEY